MKLYSFFNSSASYRVRIAMALKGIDYDTVGVNIRIGQQNALEYRRLNPVGLVPALVTDDGESLGQSLAIIDWLDRHFRKPRCCRVTIRRGCGFWKSSMPFVAISTPLTTCASCAT
jgi:Glutathione S-transferase